MGSVYPKAHRLPLVEDVHGHAVADPYRWLESHGSAETEEWLNSQRRLFEEQQATWSSRDWFATRLRELTPAGTPSIPVWRDSRRFELRAGRPVPVVVTVNADGVETTVIDPAEFDPSGRSSLVSWRPSLDGSLVCAQFNSHPSEYGSAWVFDVATGAVVDGPIGPTRRSPIGWLGTSRGFYYVRLEPHPHVRLHRIGQPAETDAVILDLAGGPHLYNVVTSHDGRWLAVTAMAGVSDRNDVWLGELAASEPERPRLRHIKDSALHDGLAWLSFDHLDGIYACTTWRAPRGRICRVDPSRPHAQHWTTLVAEDSEAVLDGMVPLAGPQPGTVRLAVSRTRHTVSDFSTHNSADGRLINVVSLPGKGRISQLRYRPDGGTETWFVYTDFTTRPAAYRYDDSTGLTQHVNPPCVVSESACVVSESVRAVTKQVVFRSFDDTEVGMLIAAPADRPDRPGPLLLHGYGGFGAFNAPTYSPSVAAWIQAGGVYAVPHIRGGGEQGTEWHLAGRGQHKATAIADFTAAAQWLIDQGWTSREQMAIWGSSHGGFLIAAALTQRPELFAAAVSTNPVLDMVRSQLLGGGEKWTEEFGTVTDPEQASWLLRCSPYHNVRPGVCYPAVLLACGAQDTRTPPEHAYKMAAALQRAAPAARPILLRVDPNSGHVPSTPDDWHALLVDTLAFAATHTGLDPRRPPTVSTADDLASAPSTAAAQ
jgi:prolyl oligopeptidase